MKRSTINNLIDDTIDFARSMKFLLPAWATWSPADWKGKGEIAAEIVDTMMGWDITDFGLNDFERTGLIMFTIRNGSYKDSARYAKPYAEKILIVRESQVTPMHFHWKKREDIINRGGGELVIELYNSTPEEGLAKTPVTLSIDGLKRTVQPGEKVILKPGDSICMTPGLYHRFYGKPGAGKILVGEVSCVNDDNIDNRFLDSLPRFPTIEEDEKPRHLLFSEVRNWL
jgi:D-lyxose ketol-isomerase